MESAFDFRNLFVLDLANNHQGSVEHGKKIIQAMSEVCNKHGVRAAVKFQFRQLDTFIHPSHHEGSDFNYVQRFLATRLKQDEFKLMLDDVRSQGMIGICTPFDEESVDVIVRMGFDVLKVASCSAKDWPLLEEIANAGKPVIFSTGGLDIEDIDNLASFLQHRGVEFAIMHCVAIYPTPDHHMNLHQIRTLKDRYPDLCVGWSTHERPEDIAPVQMAVALGADLFERHVGVNTDEIKLNDYSSTPEQLASHLERGRVRRAHGGAGRQEAIDDVECGRLPHVVRPRLECESPDRKDLVGQAGAELLVDVLEAYLGGGHVPKNIAEIR